MGTHLTNLKLEKEEKKKKEEEQKRKEDIRDRIRRAIDNTDVAYVGELLAEVNPNGDNKYWDAFQTSIAIEDLLKARWEEIPTQSDLTVFETENLKGLSGIIPLNTLHPNRLIHFGGRGTIPAVMGMPGHRVKTEKVSLALGLRHETGQEVLVLLLPGGELPPFIVAIDDTNEGQSFTVEQSIQAGWTHAKLIPYEVPQFLLKGPFKSFGSGSYFVFEHDSL